MKKCIVTGGAGYLGSNICHFFAKKNFKVYCLDNNRSALKDMKNKNSIIKVQIDITDKLQVEKFFKSLKSSKLDVLINNAAIDAVPTFSKKLSENNLNTESWINEFKVGIIGSNLMINMFKKKVIRYKEGSIINIGSDLSVISPNQSIYKSYFGNYKKPASYSVIKHGLLGLTKYYSTQFAEYGIKVNMVSPAPIKNPKNVLSKELKKLIPSKNLTKISDILKTLYFLSNNDNQNLTGQNILIDGGRSII
ncbi:SDR family oxidoreductase [Candidatus Pelagibacter bacterium nBUS_44]|uniref:SDR family oxidoreductase n=1 Tax=Candidatus Pelagibacter bacterium nBUS_44 TaxID=3374195 RepID=UPI003EBF382A